MDNLTSELRGGEWETRGYKAGRMGLKTVGPETIVFFGVDDYHNDPSTFDSDLCILPVDKNRISKDFDYYFDLTKVSSVGHTEIMDFIGKSIEAKCGESKEEIQIEDLDDEQIHKHLQDRFGSLAVESQDYRELFRNYKAEVLEEYKLRVKEANGILAGLKEVDPEKKVEEVNAKMKPLRPVKFITSNDNRHRQSGNVFKSQLDPYKVPRYRPEEFVLRNAIAEKGGKSPVNEDYALLKQSTNLTYLEPCLNDLTFLKFSGCLQFPLVRSILKVIGAFPLGLTPNFLYEEFERRNGYRIDFCNLGFSSFEDLLRQNESAFRVLTGKTSILVFSAFQENIAGVDVIHRKVHHYLSVMVNMLKGPVPVEQVEVNMANMFGISLNLRAWGFKSPVLFYRLLLSMWDTGTMEIVPSDEKPLTYYIQSIKEQEPTAVVLDAEMIGSFPLVAVEGECGSSRSDFQSEPTSAAQTVALHKTFTLNDFYLSSLNFASTADMLQIGSIYYVRPELMVTPSHFYVSLENKFESRDNFILEMTTQYELWAKDVSWNLFSVSPDLFNSILYIAIKFEDEWARGRIVKKWNNGYKVLLVDMGLYIRDVKLEDMKYLHKNFIGIPELSVCCSLQQNVLSTAFPLENIRQNIYPDETLKQFYSVLSGHLCGIMPFTRNRDRKWEVYMYLVPDEFSRTTILLNDVALYLVQKKCEVHGRAVAKERGQHGKRQSFLSY